MVIKIKKGLKILFIILFFIASLALGIITGYKYGIDNNNEISSSTPSDETSSEIYDLQGLLMIRIFKPCDDCVEPDYESTIINLADSESLYSLVTKLETKTENTIDGIGLGENPLYFQMFYTNNTVIVTIIDENTIAIKSNEEESYKIYDLQANTNIKTFIINLYNQNVN